MITFLISKLINQFKKSSKRHQNRYQNQYFQYRRSLKDTFFSSKNFQFRQNDIFDRNIAYSSLALALVEKHRQGPML